MIRRLITLQILLLAGLGSVFFLPGSDMRESALNMKLPSVLTLTGWTGGKLSAVGSPEEVARLAADTGFAKRTYRREVPASEQDARQYYPGLVDELHTGIVLSGKDLSASIHALERCLTAQGFEISEPVTMKVKLRSGQVMPVRRLLCQKAFQDKSGKLFTARNISYYWFVGHDSVTSSHIQRGIKDFRDRIVGGYDQRWGYVTVTAQLDPERIMEIDEEAAKAPRPENEPPPYKAVKSSAGTDLIRRPLTPAQADHLVEEFISDLGPDIIAVDQIANWPEE